MVNVSSQPVNLSWKLVLHRWSHFDWKRLRLWWW